MKKRRTTKIQLLVFTHARFRSYMVTLPAQVVKSRMFAEARRYALKQAASKHHSFVYGYSFVDSTEKTDAFGWSCVVRYAPASDFTYREVFA